VRWAYIVIVLEANQWDIKRASAILNISENRLQREVRRMGLSHKIGKAESKHPGLEGDKE
jgi:transcriptional regulator of acetoin/glycerol metabolism